MYYFEIFEEFFKNEIKYLIAGGLAVNLYGIPRVTMDVDIIIDLKKDNLEKLRKVLNYLNYKSIYPDIDFIVPEKIELWIKEKNMIAFSLKNTREPYKQIDILLPCSKNFDYFWKKRVERKVNNISIYLISKEDLIKIKQNTSRLQDRKDIELLSKLQ